MGSGCVESIYRGVIHCVFDQIPTLQNYFTTPKQKPRRRGGPQTDKHLPPNPFTGHFIRKDDL
jgi:hypothetical protein